MDVQIVVFPETRVAAVEHFGPPTLEHETARKLISWKLERRLLDPLKYRSYGVHYTDPYTTAPADHHVDFCLSFEEDVGFNSFGIINKVIPRNRCAVARDIGSRYSNQAAVFLYNEWLPRSGESLGDFPIFFHYVNVGPNLREEEMITDVYLPLRWGVLGSKFKVLSSRFEVSGCDSALVIGSGAGMRMGVPPSQSRKDTQGVAVVVFDHRRMGLIDTPHPSAWRRSVRGDSVW